MKCSNSADAAAVEQCVCNACEFVVAEFALALTLLASGARAQRFLESDPDRHGHRHRSRARFVCRCPIVVSKVPIKSRLLSADARTHEAMPGVEKVAASTGAPARGANFGVRVGIVGQPPPANPNDRRVRRFR